MSKDYRVSEICPYCGNALTHSPKYHDDIQGIYIEVEYGLKCEKCGTIDYFSYGQWDGDCDLQMMDVEPMQWIPCAVRFPEEDELVLASCEDFYKGKKREFICELNYDGNNKWSIDNCSVDFTVTAWVPRPEPYKGGDADGRT